MNHDNKELEGEPLGEEVEYDDDNTQQDGEEGTLEDMLGEEVDLDDYDEDDEEEEDDEGEAPQEVKPHKEGSGSKKIPPKLISQIVRYTDSGLAMLCMAISGDTSPNKYKHSEAENQNLVDATCEYLDTTDIGLSPGWAFLMVVLLYVSMPVGSAFFARRANNLKKEEDAEKAARRAQQEEDAARRNAEAAQIAAQTPQESYFDKLRQTKEAQDRRKSFKLNSAGKYEFPPDSASSQNRLKVDESTEYPSPLILELIKKEMPNATIHELLGYKHD